jgi:hypothetical protein
MMTVNRRERGIDLNGWRPIDKALVSGRRAWSQHYRAYEVGRLVAAALRLDWTRRGAKNMCIGILV